jgi:hypothetical protein
MIYIYIGAELGFVLWRDKFSFFGWGDGPTYINTKSHRYLQSLYMCLCVFI